MSATTTSTTAATPDLPLPISRVANHYFIYDVNHVMYLRKTHHILGVAIGSIPHAPQQSIFLGLPLELLPEEARLLVEKGVAHVVDDVKRHELAFRDRGLSKEESEVFRKLLAKEGREAARRLGMKKGEDREKALQKVKGGKKSKKGGKEKLGAPEAAQEVEEETPDVPTLVTSAAEEQEGADEDTSLFSSPAPSASMPTSSIIHVAPFHLTPTTSHPPLALPAPPATPFLPEANPNSYALFRHLHSKGYYMNPGIRFGCQFNVYPGDIARYHSHFLAQSYGWDEEFALLDLVGGGRLGTGVKKGWLIGGPVEEDDGEGEQGAQVKGHPEVRTFCLEWGGM